jgi:hypothetical protein
MIFVDSSFLSVAADVCVLGESSCGVAKADPPPQGRAGDAFKDEGVTWENVNKVKTPLVIRPVGHGVSKVSKGSRKRPACRAWSGTGRAWRALAIL